MYWRLISLEELIKFEESLPKILISSTYTRFIVETRDKIVLALKDYLLYKTIFCHAVVFNLKLMNFFIWRKNNTLFLRYLDFCVFAKSSGFKICVVIITLPHNGSYTFSYSFWALSTIKNWSNTSVLYEKHFQDVLAQC